MDTFFQQISSILVSAPGNLIYHIVLAFCLAASLQAALLSSRRSVDAHPGRLILGLTLVLMAQLVLFAASGLAWQQVADAHRFAPPLDRVVTAFSLVWVVWLWVFPRPARLADILAVLLSLAILVIAVYTFNGWQVQPAGTPFNGSPFDWYWELSSLITVSLGMLALVIARPPYWGVGLASLALLITGYTINLMTINPSGDYSGTVRLAQLCAYLMLPVLAQRLLYNLPEPVSAPAAEEEAAAPQVSAIDLRLAQAWSALAAENDPEQRVAALSRAVAQSLHADLCFLLSSPDATGLWKMPGGFDLVSDEPLTAAAIEADRIPRLANALQRGKPIQILAEDTGKTELTEIGRLFGLENAGNLVAAPLISHGRVWGGIVLLSPYSHRAWDDDSQAFLTNLSESLTQTLQSSPDKSIQQVKLEEDMRALQAENSALNAQILGLRQEKQNLDVTSLLAVQQEAQEMIAQLQAENDELRKRQAATAETGSGKDQEQFEGELRLVLQEVAMLKNQLAEANMDLEKARHVATRSPARIEGQEMVTSISQDFRQPMSGIMGYADLLLADTAGLLTAEQRIFIERIKSAAERLRSMVNDLVRAAALAGGQQRLEKEPVDLEAAINEAVSCNNALLREKSITLRLALPDDDLPVITADQQAVQQILVDLLRNAGSISPEGSEVVLQVEVETGADRQASVLFRVTDSGGGIAEADLPRVFKPQYRAGDALVQGTADAGSGLPVVEALVKAQGGEVWVETVAGKAASFNVRLPVIEPTASGREAR